MMTQTEAKQIGPSLTMDALKRAKADILEACGGQLPIAGIVVVKGFVTVGYIYEVEATDTKRRYAIINWLDYFKLCEYIEIKVESDPWGGFAGIPVYEDDELAYRLLFEKRFNKRDDIESQDWP